MTLEHKKVFLSLYSPKSLDLAVLCLRYADDITLMAESEEELKSLLMKVKVQSEKVGFKAQHSENKDHGIWSHHFMANRWENSGNSVRLYFWGLQNHCRW